VIYKRKGRGSSSHEPRELRGERRVLKGGGARKQDPEGGVKSESSRGGRENKHHCSKKKPKVAQQASREREKKRRGQVDGGWHRERKMFSEGLEVKEKKKKKGSRNWKRT